MRYRYKAVSRALFIVLALGAVACGSILGLGEYEISGDSHAPTTSDGGDSGPVVLAGGITISTTSLAFPDGKCGEQKTLPIVITNASAAPVPLVVTAPAGITVDGSAPSIPAKGSVTLTIGTTGVDAGTITLKVGDQSYDVRFAGKFAGPRLALDTSTVDFGEIRHDLKSSPQTVNLENTSDEDVTVTGVAAGKDFMLDAPVTVSAHGKAVASFTMTAGPGGDPITASASLTTDKPVCDALPALVFKGRRSPTDVTVGKTSVQIACTGGTQTPVVVSNYGANTVTIAVTAVAPVTVTPQNIQLGEGTGEMPATIGFNLYGIPPLGDYSYSLQITEGALAPRTVTVQVHVYGAKMQYDTTQLSLDGGTTVSRPATNIGNVPVCLHYALGGGGGDSNLVTFEPDEQFDPNVAGDFKVTGTANPTGPHHQRFKFRPQAIACSGATAAAPLCAGLNEFDIDVVNNN